MPRNYFGPTAGRFGTQTISLQTGSIGGANYLGGATCLTASGTTTFVLGMPGVKCRFRYMSVVQGTTLAVTSGGTLLTHARKQNAGTVVTVSSDVDLALQTVQVGKVVGTLSTATEPQLLFNGTSDYCQVDVVSNAAIGTQPVGLVVVAWFEVLR